MASAAPIAALPISDEPPYVTPSPPPITLYQDRADVDVVYLIEITPFVPAPSA